MLGPLQRQSAVCVTAGIGMGGIGFSLKRYLLCCPRHSWEEETLSRTFVQDVSYGQSGMAPDRSM